MSMHLRIGLGLSVVGFGAGIALAGCGAADDGEHSRGDDESTGTVREFVTWNPSSAILTQHVDWHTLPCSANGQPLAGQAGVGRRCSRPGEDFLIWHRAFIKRLRAEFEAQGLTHDIRPWYSVPAEISSHSLWTSSAADANAAMYSWINPNTGQRFASLDEFGTVVEGMYHGLLHTISAQVWGTTDAIVGGFMSPRSTLFFKIHGYVDFHLSRFLHGDFNWDGKSDLVIRNIDTGANSIWYMNDTTVSSQNSITSLSHNDGCKWYVGATPDLDFDGRLDLVWHGPGCGRTVAWFMNGLTRKGTAELNSQSSAFALFGHGDFNGDSRPDLLWRNSNFDVVVWRMNGSQRLATTTIDVPAGWTPIIAADLNNNGTPDLIYRGGALPESREYAVDWGGTGTPFSIVGLSTDPFSMPQAVGRYRTSGTAGDFFFQHLAAPPAPADRWAQLLRSASLRPSYSAPTAAAVFSPGERIQGPR